jgi:hypothetical protein
VRGLEAAVRVENELTHRIVRDEVPVGGTKQREAAAFSVDGVNARGERHVATAVSPFPDGEPMRRRPARGPAPASKLTSASASLPWGELVESFGRILTDTTLPFPLDKWTYGDTLTMLDRRRGRCLAIRHERAGHQWDLRAAEARARTKARRGPPGWRLLVM